MLADRTRDFFAFVDPSGETRPGTRFDGAGYAECHPFENAAESMLRGIVEMATHMRRQQLQHLVRDSSRKNDESTETDDNDSEEAFEQGVLEFSTACDSEIKRWHNDNEEESNELLRQHLRGVELYLYDRLEQLTQKLAKLRQMRQKRMEEKTRLLNPLAELAVRADTTAVGPSVDLDADFVPGSEQRMLQEEEAALLARLDSDLDQVRRNERQMHMIASLVRNFSSKVRDQAEQLDSIHAEAVAAKAHVDAADEELHKTLSYGIGARLYFLVLMLVLGLSVLFLDWYHP